MRIKIVVADDHRMFLEGLGAMLVEEPNIEVVATCRDGAEVLKVLQAHAVDLVISDISMPGVSGLELTRQVKAEFPEVGMIALSMHDDGPTITKMVKAGVDGYVLKDDDKATLMETLRKVADKEKFFGPRVQAALMNSLIQTKAGKTAMATNRPLTDREREILVLIALEFTETQIADKLCISPNTVVYHKRKLMAMLEVKSVAGLVRHAVEMGLLQDT